MPGWGTGSFESEDAQSFLGRLNSLGIDDLRQILVRAADQDDYLEAPESSIAVAAAEVVAALVVAAKKGAPSPAAPREIMDWASKNWTSENKTPTPPDLIDLARRAVERVRTNSELKDLWLEAEGLNEWSAALRELKERLSG
jgi:hypothetical protein